MPFRHTLAKTFRQWALVIWTGAVGLAVGIAGCALIGLDGIFRALNASPLAGGAILCGFMTLAALGIGALVALTTERHRTLLARIALNNMSQALCMFDHAGRLVLCNSRYIDMHLLRREQLRAGMPLREMLDIRIENGTFTGDPDRYAEECIRNAAEGHTHKRTIKFTDGRTIALVMQPLPNGGWVTTHTDVTEQFVAEEERDSLRRRDEGRRSAEVRIASFRGRVVDSHRHRRSQRSRNESCGAKLALDVRPYAATRRGRCTRVECSLGECRNRRRCRRGAVSVN